MSISLGWPEALFALACLPLFFLFARGSRYAISRARLVRATAVRALAIVLLTLGVADARVGLPTHELAVLAIVDDRPSISETERAQTLASLRTVAARSTPDASLAIAEDRAGMTFRDRLLAGVARLPLDHVRRVLVATDGRDPGLAAEVADIRRSGATVDLLSLGDDPFADDFSVAAVHIPRGVRAGERAMVEVEVVSSTARTIPLSIAIDGRPVASASHDAPVGSSIARVELALPERAGLYALDVAAVARESGRRGENDLYRLLFEVLPKPRVMIMRAEGEPLLASVLRDAGLDVDVIRPSAAPTELRGYDRYALVLTDEIELGDLGEPEQRALRGFVETMGGGWLGITGAHPVRRTPTLLRQIEPIEPPPALPEPRPLELMLIIDRSSSMSGFPMEQARRSAVSAVRALRRDSRVGAVAFSSAADRVLPPVPMEQQPTVERFIQGIHADGGTNIAAAISAANRAMSSDPRYIHHAILISDGESEPQAAIAAAMALAGRGVSISCITIGSYSQLLAEIARIGRGRYHATSASGLQSLVVNEAMMRQPPAARQTSFTTREVEHLSMFDGVDLSGAPAFAGHALASTRTGASTVFSATEGMPLLAFWHRGAGKVATFTSATNGSWSDAFRQTDAFRRLFVALSRGLLRDRPVDPPRIHLERSVDDASLVDVTVVSPVAEAEPRPIVRFARASDAERGNRAPEALSLEMRGPGVFHTRLPIGFTLLVDARMPSDPEPTAVAGIEEPYPRALAAFGPDAARLATLAALGGGELLTAPEAVLTQPRDEEVARSLRTPLFALALLCYLLSLLMLRWPDHSVATANSLVVPTRRDESRQNQRVERTSVPPTMPGAGPTGGGGKEAA